MKYAILAFIIFTLMACTKNDMPSTIFLECNQIAENNKPYNGEEIDCQCHYYLTEYNNQQYIQLECPCYDLTRPYVFNEDCVDICENGPYDEDSECYKFLNGKKTIEILLIEK